VQEVQANRAVLSVPDRALRDQLQARRQRLREALPRVQKPERLAELLQQVDAALESMDAGTFGLCETCHDPIESDRLLANPLCRHCLDHLSPTEQRALERDLALAFQVQRGLLPQATCAVDGWSVAYHYEPAGSVSGDYCDLIPLEDDTALFLIGDITGKGIAASMLMAHLHAIFRSLTITRQPVADLVSGANRVFSQGISSSHFATLACGSLGHGGVVDICNAGHCRPLHVSRHGVATIDGTGVPLGILPDWEYTSHRLCLEAGDSLVLYTDGLSEAFNAGNQQYGAARLAKLLQQHGTLASKDLLGAILEDLKAFRSRHSPADDLTIMVIRRVGVDGAAHA